MERVTERPPKTDEQEAAAALAIPPLAHALDDAHF